MTKPKIVIDGTCITPMTDGLTRYVMGLVGGFIKIGANRDFRFEVLLRPGLPNVYADVVGAWREQRIDITILDIPAIGPLRDLRYWRWRSVSERADCFHATSNQWPVPLNRGVYTVHDAIYLRYPQSLGRFGQVKKAYLWAVMARGLRMADLVITPSQATKLEILSTFPWVNHEKIHVIPHGGDDVSGESSPQDPLTPVPAEPYFIYTGSSRYHKNLTTLVEGFIRFRMRSNGAYSTVRLVIAGRTDWLSPSLEARAKKHGVLFLGYVDERWKNTLIKRALAVIVPSLTEGFGLPVLEAFNLGVPVVCSNRGALPEVAGNAAIYVDPERPDDIADKLSLVAANPSICNELVRRGETRLQAFTWRRAAESTLRVYERALGGGD